MQSSFRHLIIFALLFLGLFFLLGLNDYMSIRPQSIHQWRQTVCLNVTLNYAEQNNSFLQTETNLLNADNETTGIAMGEFPLFYYLMGKVWRISGQSEALYRLSSLLLLFVALFALSNALFRETGSYLASSLVSLLFFVLPVAAYYAVSFLMDGVALSVLLLGWYCFYRAYKDKSKFWYFMFFILFTLTGLLKVTLLISVIALLGSCIVALMFPRFIQVNKRGWVLPTVVLLLLTIIINVIWYAYAIDYNNQHGGWITENGIYPIWELTQEKWEVVYDWVMSYWYKQYAPPLFYLLFAVSLTVFFKAKSVLKEHLLMYWIIAITLLGSLTYVMLWIQVFDNHDYYVFALYPLFFGIVIVSFIISWRKFTEIGQKLFVVFLGAVLVAGAIYTGKELNYRLTGWPNGNGENEFASYFDIEPYLRNEIGIDRFEKVIAYPDNSVCISLYLADQKGWQMNAEHDTSFIYSKMKKGASYILVNDSTFYSINGIKELGLEPIGKHKQIDILRINHPKSNSNLF